MPSETTMAICSMIFGGIFERFPKLKVCFAHGGWLWNTPKHPFGSDGDSWNPYCIIIPASFLLGGAFPYTIGRIEHGFNVRPDLCATDNKNNPRKYLGSFYTDSLVHDSLALQLLVNVIGKVGLSSPSQKILYYWNIIYQLILCICCITKYSIQQQVTACNF